MSWVCSGGALPNSGPVRRGARQGPLQRLQHRFDIGERHSLGQAADQLIHRDVGAKAHDELEDAILGQRCALDRRHDRRFELRPLGQFLDVARLIRLDEIKSPPQQIGDLIVGPRAKMRGRVR